MQNAGVATFTRAEAEALLPRAKALLLDIQRRKASYDRRPSELLARELGALIGEVQALGAEIKDLDRGLVDFRSLLRGREVYLCWMLGEDDQHIAWWHELEGGFAGRRLIED